MPERKPQLRKDQPMQEFRKRGTRVQVFPSGVDITANDVSIVMKGIIRDVKETSQGRITGEVDSGNNKSKFSIGRDGEIIFRYLPPERELLPALSPAEIKQRLERASIKDPSSFEGIPTGQILRFFREQENVKLADLAQSIGKSKGYYSRIENGLKNTTEAIIRAVSQTLNWENDDPRLAILLSQVNPDEGLGTI